MCDEDPWDARTLEWMTSSPPPEYNFAEIPVVEHRDEFWHRKYTEDDQGRLVALPESERYVVPARRDPTRAAQHPHAVAVVLAVRARPRSADHGLRLRLQVLVAARRRRRHRALRYSNAWSSEPASEEAPCTDARPRSSTAASTGTPVVPCGAARARDQHRRQQQQARDLALHRVGEPLLRCVHHDVLPLPRPRRDVPQGPDADGAPQHPVHVGDVVRAADELAHDGARARRDPARRPPPLPPLGPRAPRSSASRSSARRSTSSPSSTARASTSAPTCSARPSTCSPASTART